MRAGKIKFLEEMANQMKNQKSAQDIQDEIFRKMTVEERVARVSDFSMFLLNLNKLGKSDGFSEIDHRDSKDS